MINARFKINENKGMLIYKLDIKRYVTSLLSIIPIALIFGYFEYQGLGEIKFGLRIGILVFVLFFIIILIEFIYKYILHQIFILRFINSMKKKNSDLEKM